jgi:DNA transformation protein and related proteins
VPGDSFKDFVLDQLAVLPGLRARAMFGGHGLYEDGKFFAILFQGRLYFKVSARTRRAYEAHGMGPFTYEMPQRTITMNYYEVPAAVLENREAAVAWARAAVRVSGAKAPSKSRANARRGKTRRG